jgi:hypothetical protein
LDFEAARFRFGIFGDGFVNVGSHSLGRA